MQIISQEGYYQKKSKWLLIEHFPPIEVFNDVETLLI